MSSYLPNLASSAVCHIFPDTCVYRRDLFRLKRLHEYVRENCPHVTIENSWTMWNELTTQATHSNVSDDSSAVDAVNFINESSSLPNAIMKTHTSDNSTPRTISADSRIVTQVLIWGLRASGELAIIITRDRGMHIEARRQKVCSILLDKDNGKMSLSQLIQQALCGETKLPEKLLAQRFGECAPESSTLYLPLLTALELLHVYTNQEIPNAQKYKGYKAEYLWAKIRDAIASCHSMLQNTLSRELLNGGLPEWNADQCSKIIEVLLLALSYNNYRVQKLLRACH